MKYKLLEALLPLLSQYESEHKLYPPDALKNFSEWLLNHLAYEALKSHYEEESYEFDTNMTKVFLENNAYIVYLYRYAKNYARRVLPPNSLISFDDFSYLIMLFHEGQHTKIQLIEKNIHEKSTGIEIIKRLVKLKLVNELPNTTDKRSIFVELSPLGYDEMKKILDKMSDLTVLVNGNLTPEESRTLHTLLQKLDFFHRAKFYNRKKDLSE